MKEFIPTKIEDLPKNAKVLFDVDYPMFPDQSSKVILLEDYLIFWTEFTSIIKPEKKVTQEEYPISAIPWFVKTIEENYWGDGGDKTTTSEQTVINGETIGISSMRHCCAENLPGYNFWNKSRKDHITNLKPQEWDIPKYMLKEGLLDQLKGII